LSLSFSLSLYFSLLSFLLTFTISLFSFALSFSLLLCLSFFVAVASSCSPSGSLSLSSSIGRIWYLDYILSTSCSSLLLYSWLAFMPNGHEIGILGRLQPK
ncbi:unnamed protein product, partial [Prunus brigantina]